MRWWRVMAKRGDFEYGGVGCYENETEAKQVATSLNRARSPKVRGANFQFYVVQDGDMVSVVADRARVLKWAESLIE